ncbi:MAG: FAD-dependent oxidoreductase [Oscillospiraceae bacterium]|nr:FAD-dependent oxidoreductase [Oscillospiraceae bacterium]
MNDKVNPGDIETCMNHKSVWQQEAMPAFPALPGDMQADAVIVGAGLCGLLCAYMLHRKGLRDIALIDANEVCSGVTATTTAKITSQHGLIYAKLLKGAGAERAKQYLAANETAIQHYREIIERENINCGFTPCNAWIYSTDNAQAIEDEVRAAQKLGMAAVFAHPDELPIQTAGALQFPGQAHFHPLQFARHICEILTAAGCRIYTHTKATGIEDGAVITNRGKILAKHIISASHYPFIDKTSLLFAKIFQERSYVLALQNAGTLRDVYLDSKHGGFSFRPYGNLVLLGAVDHKTGHETDARHFDGLLSSAQELYPGAETAFMWSAQDCMTHDGIPYIGRLKENLYIATGFNKWGMTSGMAAADMISDLITQGRSDFAEVFSLKGRDIGLQAKSFCKETADIAGNLLTGLTHAVEPVCTHMGCAVKWNPDEETWDCTCHGSRFDPEGQVLCGPALKPLKRTGGKPR